jgi:hypothetical protein
MITTKRAAGYCRYPDCVKYAQTVRVHEQVEGFYCSRCRRPGHVERERHELRAGAGPYPEVRVVFGFDPVVEKYRKGVIVRADSLEGGWGVYTLCSPLIRSKRRALKIAAEIVTRLNGSPVYSQQRPGVTGIGANELPQSTEVVLSFDDDLRVLRRKLAQLSSDDGPRGSAAGPA